MRVERGGYPSHQETHNTCTDKAAKANVRAAFFKCQIICSMSHHSTRWAELLSTVVTTCAPPTDGLAHSDLTILSA